MATGAVTRSSLGRRASSRWWLAGALLVCAMIFGGLGVWQIQRLGWKHELIARVTARAHATPVAPPPVGEDPAGDEYRKVRVSGHYMHDHETLTLAVTALGGGVWVMTPLRTDDGTIIFVNRGFAPRERKKQAGGGWAFPEGRVTATGLLRLSEPSGGFLRKNQPEAGRWFSRDVGAIAARQGLGTVAQYFIDVDATPNPGGYPVGGLTVLRFRDDHFVYALTWFALALMSLAGAALGIFHGRSTAGGQDGP